MIRRSQAFQVLQLVSSLACAILVWRYTFELEGTEFSGGRITGVLLDMANVAVVMFVIALITFFWRTRISAAAAFFGSLLALPIYFYFVCPGPFRRIFKGNYSAPAPAPFVWDAHSVTEIFALIVAAALCVRNFVAFKQRIES